MTACATLDRLHHSLCINSRRPGLIFVDGVTNTRTISRTLLPQPRSIGVFAWSWGNSFPLTATIYGEFPPPIRSLVPWRGGGLPPWAPLTEPSFQAPPVAHCHFFPRLPCAS